jgi:hypothetical protein
MAFSAVSAHPEIAFNRCNAAVEHLAGSPSLQACGGSSAWPPTRWSEWEPTAEHLTPARGQLEPEYLVSATHSVSRTPTREAGRPRPVPSRTGRSRAHPGRRPPPRRAHSLPRGAPSRIISGPQGCQTFGASPTSSGETHDLTWRRSGASSASWRPPG